MASRTDLVRNWLIPVALVLVAGTSTLLGDEPGTDAALEQGRSIAFDRNRGNCLACHAIEGGEFAGNYGPPLVMMKSRFPDRAALRAQIWDAAVRDPATRMPPYGRHRILTEREIDLVVDFVYSL
jgi:sulfur-oxidizing protein SoxX